MLHSLGKNFDTVLLLLVEKQCVVSTAGNYDMNVCLIRHIKDKTVTMGETGSSILWYNSFVHKVEIALHKVTYSCFINGRGIHSRSQGN